MSLKRKIKQVDSITIKEEKITPNKRQKKHIKIEFETVSTENLPPVQAVFDLLSEKYGKPRILKSGASESTCGRKETLCEAAVALILSQNTSNTNSNRAWVSLVKKFGTMDNVRVARVEDIEESIRSGGLANVKAKRIKSFLDEIYTRYGETSLEFLRSKPIDEVRETLLSFKGIGPKCAACLMSFSMGLPEFAVDTHVHRLCNRIGWVSTGANRDKTYAIMANIIPNDIKLAMHVLLIKHGRLTCKAGKPNCGDCPLTKHCQFYKLNKESLEKGEVREEDKENVKENAKVIVMSPRTRINVKKNMNISESSDEVEDDDGDYNEEELF
jgi:endonuclease-3